jgi:sarcosine oxidase subunit gamma
MAELARHGPLDTVAAPHGATVTVLGPCIRHVLRGREAAVTRAGDILGLAMPQTPCRSAVAGTVSALWLGPDEWLLLTDDAAILAPLAPALENLPHALVDVSHRQVALEINGPRTVLGKIEIILWRTGDTRFRVEIPRSLANYAWLLLQEAQDN